MHAAYPAGHPKGSSSFVAEVCGGLGHTHTHTRATTRRPPIPRLIITPPHHAQIDPACAAWDALLRPVIVVFSNMCIYRSNLACSDPNKASRSSSSFLLAAVSSHMHTNTHTTQARPPLTIDHRPQAAAAAAHMEGSSGANTMAEACGKQWRPLRLSERDSSSGVLTKGGLLLSGCGLLFLCAASAAAAAAGGAGASPRVPAAAAAFLSPLAAPRVGGCGGSSSSSSRSRRRHGGMDMMAPPPPPPGAGAAAAAAAVAPATAAGVVEEGAGAAAEGGPTRRRVALNAIDINRRGEEGAWAFGCTVCVAHVDGSTHGWTAPRIGIKIDPPTHTPTPRRHPRPRPPRPLRVRAQLPLLGLHLTRPPRPPPTGAGARPTEPRGQPPRATGGGRDELPVGVLDFVWVHFFVLFGGGGIVSSSTRPHLLVEASKTKKTSNKHHIQRDGLGRVGAAGPTWGGEGGGGRAQHGGEGRGLYVNSYVFFVNRCVCVYMSMCQVFSV